jgi:hypothetical protein
MLDSSDDGGPCPARGLGDAWRMWRGVWLKTEGMRTPSALLVSRGVVVGLALVLLQFWYISYRTSSSQVIHYRYDRCLTISPKDF